MSEENKLQQSTKEEPVQTGGRKQPPPAGTGIAIGLCLGVGVGLPLQSPVLGIAIGVVFAAAFEAAFKKQRGGDDV